MSEIIEKRFIQLWRASRRWD